MGGQLATSETILVSAAGVIAADSAGLSSVKSYSTLLTSIAAMPLAGGTFTGNVLFTDNTYTIGAAGATRPSAVHVGTGGVTSAGDIVASGSSQRYVRAYGTGGVNNIAMYDDNTDGILSTNSGNLRFELGAAGGYFDFRGVAATNNPVRIWNSSNTSSLVLRHTGNSEIEASAGNLRLLASASGKYIELKPNSGLVDHYLAGVNSVYRAWNGNGNGYVEITHDSTNGVVSTVNTANINIVPAGGTVAVTGGITASGLVSVGTYTVATLPAAGSNAGATAQVTDSNVAASGNYGATVAAGGANRVRVYSDGTNWVIA